MSCGQPEVSCDYCQKPAELVGGDVIYPHRKDLASKQFWNCEPCKAYVGCHVGTTTPFGRLANAELRGAKQAAHRVFDPLWKAKMRRSGCSKQEARNKGYMWLADQLSIEREDCHIGMFDVETCKRTVTACSKSKFRRVA